MQIIALIFFTLIDIFVRIVLLITIYCTQFLIRFHKNNYYRFSNNNDRTNSSNLLIRSISHFINLPTITLADTDYLNNSNHLLINSPEFHPNMKINEQNTEIKESFSKENSLLTKSSTTFLPKDNNNNIGNNSEISSNVDDTEEENLSSLLPEMQNESTSIPLSMTFTTQNLFSIPPKLKTLPRGVHWEQGIIQNIKINYGFIDRLFSLNTKTPLKNLENIPTVHFSFDDVLDTLTYHDIELLFLPGLTVQYLYVPPRSPAFELQTTTGTKICKSHPYKPKAVEVCLMNDHVNHSQLTAENTMESANFEWHTVHPRRSLKESEVHNHHDTSKRSNRAVNKSSVRSSNEKSTNRKSKENSTKTTKTKGRTTSILSVTSPLPTIVSNTDNESTGIHDEDPKPTVQLQENPLFDTIPHSVMNPTFSVPSQLRRSSSSDNDIVQGDIIRPSNSGISAPSSMHSFTLNDFSFLDSLSITSTSLTPVTQTPNSTVKNTGLPSLSSSLWDISSTLLPLGSMNNAYQASSLSNQLSTTSSTSTSPSPPLVLPLLPQVPSGQPTSSGQFSTFNMNPNNSFNVPTNSIFDTVPNRNLMGPSVPVSYPYIPNTALCYPPQIAFNNNNFPSVHPYTIMMNNTPVPFPPPTMPGGESSDSTASSKNYNLFPK